MRIAVITDDIIENVISGLFSYVHVDQRLSAAVIYLQTMLSVCVRFVNTGTLDLRC